MLNLLVFSITLVIPVFYSLLTAEKSSDAAQHFQEIVYHPASFGYVLFIGAIFVYVNTWRKKKLNVPRNVPLTLSFSLMIWLVWFVVTFVVLAKLNGQMS
ncbi:Uncharacterised protein [BD1-7 clade bacterium]|uniref:Uncharacterized protein n=1 Tax=BD1-7 clade bacterium TaxID=2029982 RepID=A0A5S9PKP7_9GAMM|nr:Uncharacterised protein [BD1-7 clade bacterium]